ncbi:unnamed protein product [Adineta ricciae]|uniref:Uncharacterized protein n=1 Tax=Adineta ricciae TaxID=249248 RepID=A0A814G1N6_ADIRI|nr:unnamed protein product [Adineta ricciae]CAF1077074.1 unnamed protein product [Adineta ricciae]
MNNAKFYRYLLFFVAASLIIFLTSDRHLSHQYFAHEDPAFSSLAFWEDNRTLQTGRILPKPTITSDQINLTNFTLVIAACCRNVEKYLLGFQRNVRAIGALFRNYRVYLGESDSKDKTLQFIQEWANNDSKHVYVYTAGNQRSRLLFRTQRLAHCRNSLLQRARIDFPSFDYYLVLDVDVTSSNLFSVENFLSNFRYPISSWAAMTASQTDRYYDLWALRSSPTVTFDFLERARQVSFIPIAWGSVMTKLFARHYKGIPENHSLIDVESAFGGAGIYFARYLTDKCVYNGWRDYGIWFYREQCEHVTFNQCIRRNAGGGKFFINPRFHTT